MSKLDKNFPINKFLKSKEGKNVKTLLLGNGFCLDHPVLGKCFKIGSDEIFSLIGKIGLYLGKKEIEQLRQIKCPEKFLNIFRWTISKEVIIHYAEALKKGIEGQKKEKSKKNQKLDAYGDYLEIQQEYGATEVLQKFNKIFTVNYDPLFYFALLDLQNTNKKSVDGFRGEVKITKFQLIDKLNKTDGIKLYYLHGANFIMKDEDCNTLYKLNPDKILSEQILYQKNSESNEVPDIIFESRWYIKKAQFEGCDYLSYCTKQLIESEGDILIFGMSFDNDAHIIDILLKYAEHHKSNNRKIFITYMEDKKNDRMRAKNHTPKKKIWRIAEKELGEYYNNIEGQGRAKLEYRLSLLEKMIVELPIAKSNDDEDIHGIFWKKYRKLKILKNRLKSR